MRVNRPRYSFFRSFRESLLAFFIVFLCICFCLGLLYVRSHQMMKKQIQDDLKHIAATASALIDGDLHKTFKSKEQEWGDDYKKAIEPLRKVRMISSRVRFVYTMIIENGSVYFILDPTPRGDSDHDGVEDHSSIMELYKSTTPEMLEALQKNEIRVESAFSKDRWGEFLSGYAPFYDSNRIQVGIIGVDLDINQYRKNLKVLNHPFFIGLGAAFVISLIVGWVVFKIRSKVYAIELLKVQNEAYVKEKEELYRAVFEENKAVKILVDPETLKIIDANSAAADFYGYPLEVLRTMKISEINIASLNEIRKVVSEALSNKVNQFFFQHKLASGEVREVEVNTGPVEIKGKRFLFSIVFDLTERNKALEKLKWSESLLRSIMDHSPLGFYVFNAQSHKIHYFNHFFCSIWKLEEYEEKMRSGLWGHNDVFSHIETRTGNKSCFSIGSKKADGDNNRIMEDQIQIEDGRTVRCLLVKIHDDYNHLMGQLCVFEDITERCSLERLKDEFVSMVSHELKTPLTITREGIALLLDEIPGKINDKQREILKYSKRNIDRLKVLINDLLDVSKIEAGGMQLEKEKVSLVNLARDVAMLFEKNALEKGLELKFNFPQSLGEAFVDRDRMEQVLVNLIGNAVKFTEKGYIEIVIKEKEKEVEMIVHDTGVGISRENLPKIFDKFQQFDQRRERKEKGTGLGLSIVKGIIQLHQGSIKVESELGKGTIFTILLRKSI